MLTAAQAGRAFSVTAATVRRWVRLGLLRASRIRGGYLFSAKELDRYREAQAALAIEEAAYETGLSRATIYRRLRAGTLASVELPSGRRAIPRAEVERVRAARLPAR